MNLSEPFIRRPIATSLLMAAVAFVGPGVPWCGKWSAGGSRVVGFDPSDQVGTAEIDGAAAA